MTEKSRDGRGRGRPAVHDPAVIAELLEERDSTGESFAALAARSGVSAATLGRYAKRSRRHDGPKRAAFVQVLPRADEHDDRDTRRPSTTFTVILDTAGARREVLVPSGFDDRELLRLVHTLESRC